MSEQSRLPSYGGQAVMDGVMMRGERVMAIAVRAPSGEIILRTEALPARLYASRWSKIPFLRGLLALWDALGIGLKALLFSAHVGMPKDGVPLSGPTIWAVCSLAALLGLGLFFALPTLVASALDPLLPSALASNAFEGLLRLALLVGYVRVIAVLPDVRRVYANHGAEHKAINAFEAGAPLTVESVQRHSTLHTRCGTGFLLIVVIFSVVVFIFLGRPPLPLRILSRIVLVPAIAGVAYEFVRFSATHYGNRLIRLLVTPSLALQRLTTREPEDGMVAVAIVALERVLVADAVLREEEARLHDAILVDAAGRPLALPTEPVPLA